jgi:hypothetical protein
VEINMSTVTQLIDQYIAMWNETDGERRRKLIAQVWTPDASYVDPMLQAEGHTGIDTMVAQVHARFPGYRFRRTSDVDAHHDRVRFGWELGAEGGSPVVTGIDFGVVEGGKRLQAITGFFTSAPAAQPQ